MAYKKATIFYGDWLKGLRKMPREKAGVVLLELLEYGTTGKPPELDDLAQEVVFELCAGDIDRDNEKFIAKCEQNRENGKKGGAPKGNQNARKDKEENNPKQPKTTERLKKQPKQPEKEKEKEKEKDLYIAPSYKTKFHNFNERDNSAIIEKLEKRG